MFLDFQLLGRVWVQMLVFCGLLLTPGMLGKLSRAVSC